MCGQNLPVRQGIGPSPFVPVGRLSDKKIAARRASVKPQGYQYAKPVRDQSEDRELPKTIVIAVDNPSGTKPGMYWAIYERATMQRLSVWFKRQYDANVAEHTWQLEYGASWNEPVAEHAPESINMIWNDAETEVDGYVYRG